MFAATMESFVEITSMICNPAMSEKVWFRKSAVVTSRLKMIDNHATSASVSQTDEQSTSPRTTLVCGRCSMPRASIHKLCGDSIFSRWKTTVLKAGAITIARATSTEAWYPTTPQPSKSTDVLRGIRNRKGAAPLGRREGAKSSTTAIDNGHPSCLATVQKYQNAFTPRETSSTASTELSTSKAAPAGLSEAPPAPKRPPGAPHKLATAMQMKHTPRTASAATVQSSTMAHGLAKSAGVSGISQPSQIPRATTPGTAPAAPSQATSCLVGVYSNASHTR
mmetsp:Transcript_58076/g.155190  ORF Transcript_58076/g.155190 Transcript_58076/m.155190 type:complete len:279 (+) Transcript_58076:4407-5243(+)